MSNLKVESRLRAAFKEVARVIIARDRAARKHGHSQNTIGEIERALVKAYAIGFEKAMIPGTSPVGSEGGLVLDWIEIPPRARNALWSLTLGIKPGPGHAPDEPITIERITLDGRSRWIGSAHRNRKDARTFSSGGICPLINLGLFAPVEGRDDILRITSKGVAICKEYWRRWEEHDPTLPLVSIRSV